MMDPAASVFVHRRASREGMKATLCATQCKYKYTQGQMLIFKSAESDTNVHILLLFRKVVYFIQGVSNSEAEIHFTNTTTWVKNR